MLNKISDENFTDLSLDSFISEYAETFVFIQGHLVLKTAIINFSLIL